MQDTKGWAMEGHPSALTHWYAFGVGGHIGEAWRHRHRAWGDTEWPVGHGTQMGCGWSLVLVSSMQSRCSQAQRQHPSTHCHTPQRAVEHDG